MVVVQMFVLCLFHAFLPSQGVPAASAKIETPNILYCVGLYEEV